MAVAYAPEPAIEVLVVRTGTANLASVLAGLRRAGAHPQLTSHGAAVRDATHVMLPGVGAFAAAMQQLRAQGFDEPLRERLRAGRATMAICVGLQLLCEGSEESPGVVGLGIVPGCATRFVGGGAVRVPQLGWNEVQPQAAPACAFLEAGHAYFANSYRLVDAPSGWGVAMSNHGGPFVAAMERGAVLACQFHPELSGEWGLRLMRRWLQRTCDGGALGQQAENAARGSLRC